MKAETTNDPKGTGVRVQLSCRIDPETMQKLNALSKDWEMSRGEVIDDLLRFYNDECDAIKDTKR